MAVLDAAQYAGANAQVRALISRLLPPPFWAEIIVARDLPGLLNLLWETSYRQTIAPLAGARLAPATVERALWEYLARAARVPLSLLRGPPRNLLDWLWRRFEVNNLKTVLRTVERRVPADRIQASLIPLGPASALPWGVLAEAASVPAVVEYLRPTFYERPLNQALDLYRREGSLFVLEVALDLAYYGRLLAKLAGLTGRDRREAERFIGTLADSQNLLWAFRYRVYAHLAPEEILNFTLHHGLRVDASVVREIASGAPLRDVVARLWGDRLPDVERLSRLSEREALPELERIFQRYLYRLALDALKAYPFHLGVVLAYQVLLESEVRDLVTVVEGRVAGWPADRIQPYLIGSRG
ncbi:MAG: V-type ATPase subunit [Ardenticatenaceae bacterium]|nr:V-type ATPase subunit [Ardenticatenaceae bacterium]